MNFGDGNVYGITCRIYTYLGAEFVALLKHKILFLKEILEPLACLHIVRDNCITSRRADFYIQVYRYY